MNLVIVTAFHSGDALRAAKLYNWIAELGGISNNAVALIHDPDEKPETIKTVVDAVKSAKPKAIYRVPTDGKHKGWPQGPNNAFLTASRFVQKLNTPFIWIEPDCLPTKKGWLKAIEDEYSKCGKQYLGGVVDAKPPLPKKFMFGVGVYPPSVAIIAQKLVLQKMDVAFDVSISVETGTQAHVSKLFQFVHSKTQSMPSITNGIVLFHPDKAATLLDAIRGHPLDKDSAQPERPPKQTVTRKKDNKTESKELPCFVQLGRIGDILNILPIVRLWSGLCFNKPVPFLVHSDYMHVFQRIGYAHPIEWKQSINDLSDAIAYAGSHYDQVFNCQLFSKDGIKKGSTGHYNTDQWDRCGQAKRFNLLHLEIDRRRFNEEERWYKQNRKTTKPLICYNLTGTSSPFSNSDAIRDLLKSRFSDCELWDLNVIRAQSYTDQLVALDRCDVCLTVDTSTLHLAQASHCKFIALLSEAHDGWGATVSRRTPVIQLPYSEASKSSAEIESAIRNCIQMASWKPKKIWHLVQRRSNVDTRVNRAIDSWNSFYASGSLYPFHVWKTCRDSFDTLGDKRRLPFLKDVFRSAMEYASKDDVIVFTNDDISIHERCIEEITRKLRYVPIVTSARSDIVKRNEDTMTYRRHLGRDLVAMRCDWLAKGIDEIPDFIIGASEWDIVLACLARLKCGFETCTDSIGFIYPDCETSHGTLIHEIHDAEWNQPANVDSLPSQKHNRLLAEEWFRTNLPEVRLHWFSRL